MCGINGFNWNDHGMIARMNDDLKERGPDDHGVFVDDGVSLGHRRLSILDLSDRGHQPMHFEHLVIVFNGEVYNFGDIKKDLEPLGYQFHSGTDTEVILKAYHAWGVDCLSRFNGMYAFAIWDGQKKEFFIARDRSGIKPLYYYHKDGRFIFSSTIKPIIHMPQVDRSIVPERISFVYTMSCVPGDMTMHRFVHQLPAGHYMVVNGATVTVKKYWDPYPQTSRSGKDYVAELRALVEDSVRLRLISDVPVGIFLSGGIDSCIIAAMAKRLSNQQIKTFTTHFGGGPEWDRYNRDAMTARRVAADLGADHHEVELRPGDALAYMETQAAQMEMPNSMTTAIPCHYLSQYAKKHVSVVLGGDGGDELFGGYERYQLSYVVSQWQRLPAVVRRYFPYAALGRLLNRPDFSQKLNMPYGLEHYLALKCYPGGDASLVFKNHFQPGVVGAYLSDHFFTDHPLLSQPQNHFMDVDRQTWLIDHSLIRTDKVTMRFALEERVPLLDYRIVELAAGMPQALKFSLLQNKKILRQAFRTELLPYVVNQPKHGWYAPAAKWLRSELKTFAYDILSDDYVPDSAQFINLPQARLLLDQHIAGTRYNLHLIWILLTWQQWYKNYVRS